MDNSYLSSKVFQLFIHCNGALLLVPKMNNHSEFTYSILGSDGFYQCCVGSLILLTPSECPYFPSELVICFLRTTGQQVNIPDLYQPVLSLETREKPHHTGVDMQNEGWVAFGAHNHLQDKQFCTHAISNQDQAHKDAHSKACLLEEL